MRRFIVLMLSSASLVGALAPSAFAAAPLQERTVATFDDVFPASICGFSLQVHVEINSKTIVFLDANGDPVRGISTGPLFATVTNSETGTERKFAISGPSFYRVVSGDLVLIGGTGRWLTFTEDGRFVIAAGNLVLDNQGTILSTRGYVTSICELIA